MTADFAQDYLFEFAGFLATCAEMALSPRGGPRYCALRFIEALNRVIELPNHVTSLKRDAFLQGIAVKLGQLNIEPDQLEKLQQQLQDILIEFAEEATRRIEQRPL